MAIDAKVSFMDQMEKELPEGLVDRIEEELESRMIVLRPGVMQ